MRIQFLGTGDAFGSGGRFHTCFYVDAVEQRFLIDCGASSMIALRRHDIDPDYVDAILISHLHGDHFGGLPFFLIDARYKSRRQRPLTIAGPPGIEGRVRDATHAFFPGSTEKPFDFELSFVELDAGRQSRIDSFTVTPYPVVHPSGAPSYALRIECADKILAFSGDTEWTDALIDVARDADLFICECSFYESDVPYHIDYRTLSKNRDRLGCRSLVLTHMGDDMLSRLDSIDIECAEDGKTIVV